LLVALLHRFEVGGPLLIHGYGLDGYRIGSVLLYVQPGDRGFGSAGQGVVSDVQVPGDRQDEQDGDDGGHGLQAGQGAAKAGEDAGGGRGFQVGLANDKGTRDGQHGRFGQEALGPAQGAEFGATVGTGVEVRLDARAFAR
jgi:hypothetical protein